MADANGGIVRRKVPLETEFDCSFSRVQVCLVAAPTSRSQRVLREKELVARADALAQLPQARREAVMLHHLQGATLAEVAAKPQRAEAAVAGLLHRGLKQLRELLSEPSSGHQQNI